MIDLLVVHCPVGGGHKAAALAVAEAARARGASVAVEDAFACAPRWAGDAYLTAHLAGQNALPDVYGEMYFRANRRGGIFDPLRTRFDSAIFGGLVSRVRELAPRAIVATHHLPLVVLGRERRKGRLASPIVGVVTDYIAHACWAEIGVDAWAVPTARAREELAAHGADRDRIFVSGIPVRRAFERIPALEVSRHDRTRVLVTSGGLGVGPIERIVRSFRETRNVDLVVVCGSSEKLVHRVTELCEREDVSANVLGFEQDMPSRLALAHVVVGKAGGLTVSESMAAGRPMVIASAIPGNEAINEAFVIEGGAGAAARPDEVGAVVDALRQRGLLEQMGSRARRMVPRGSASAVVEGALSLAVRTSAAA